MVNKSIIITVINTIVIVFFYYSEQIVKYNNLLFLIYFISCIAFSNQNEIQWMVTVEVPSLFRMLLNMHS